jgi:glycosyltransferase involved in cell wall biosynthesis
VRKRLLLLYDWYYAPGYNSAWYLPDWCEKDYSVKVFGYRRPLRVGIRFRRIRGYLEYLRLATLALLNRHSYDALVFWAWPIGILVAFIVRLFRLQCSRIVILNLITYRETGLRSWVKQAVISYALGRADVVAVAARGLLEKYREAFGYKGKMYFLPDPFDANNSATGEAGDYIFSGGISLRDWPTLMEAARRVDRDKFIVCAASSDRTLAGLSLPHNVTIKYDVSYDEFYRLLANSKFVILPLVDAEATSGLMVLLRAFDYQKAVIATSTVCTVDYIEDGKNGLLVCYNDVNNLVEKTHLLSNDTNLIRELGANAKSSLRRFSWESYYRQFHQMLSDLFDEKGKTESRFEIRPSWSADNSEQKV